MPGLTIHGELGRGAYAVVYQARRHGIDYALKLMRESVFVDAAAIVAFRREAALLACVNHPGVVAIHEVGQVRGRPYLVMELVEGRTLADALGSGRLDEAHAATVAADVAEALAAAHRAGLTHRDVKPQNIMILPDGRSKVIDFGLAARPATASADDAVVGTFAYSAPEQTGMLKRLVDGRSDLYSLGAVLFHAVTGQPPFTAIDMGELLRQHSVTVPPDVRELRPELSAGFAAVVARLLAKDPDDRYQTGQALAADLRALAGDGSGTVPLGTATGTAGPVEAPLVGRAAELGQLTARWARARDGTGGIAVIAGPPGGGKSRLVRELVASATTDGHLALHGKSSPDDPVPMGPLRAAVDRYLGELDRLPEPKRTAARERVRHAAGRGASLLGALSPALAALLSAPELADENRQEQFAVSVATFLTGLAQVDGGALLCLDDVQWLDAGTRLVLHHLTDDLADSPLLVAATARDDAASRGAYDAFRTDFDAATDTRIVLHPLDDAAIAKIVQGDLSSAALTPQLTQALVERSGGNPFTAHEYARAVVDAGLVRPSWGTWVLEEGALDALDLPDNVLDLIQSRVAGLGTETRRLLVTAAAIGIRFRLSDLARTCGIDERQVLAVLRLATDRRLVTGGPDGYTFLHDRIREALLADLDDAGRRALHMRIALALDEVDETDPEHVYAVARHYDLGDPAQVPARAYRAALTAGQLALANHAPQQALQFMATAEAAAASGAVTPDIAYHETYGIAWLRVGGFLPARVHLEHALSAETEPTRRAWLRGLICEAHHSDWEVSESLAAADRALAEIGRALPRSPVALVLSTFLLFLGSLGVRWLGIGRGTATGAVRERLRIEAAVLAFAAQAAAAGRRMLLVTCLAFRQLYPVNRIGPGSEWVHAQAHLAGVAKMLGLRRLSDRMFRVVSRTAARLADPRLVAYVDWVDGIIETTVRKSKVDPGDMMRRVLSEHGRWLDAQEHFTAAIVLCNRLTLEGNVLESLAWYERTRVRVSHAEHGPGHHFVLVDAAIRAAIGPGAEADRKLASFREVLAARPDSLQQRIQYFVTALMSTVEQNQLDAFDQVAREFEAARLSPLSTWASQHNMWALLAYGRLAQCLAAGPHERDARLAAARRAVKLMRPAATTPVLKVHYLIIRASYRQLTGANVAALRLLARAERRVERFDVPILGFELARVRARALHALSNPAEARRQARSALHLAIECGWEHRARMVRAEFGLDQATPHVRQGTNAATVSTEIYRRRLDALQQVSLAAATVLEPRQLARVALQEMIEILGAERAFLFLVDTDTGELVPHLGRDAAGTDLEELTGYGASLVTRVRTTDEPLVITGGDDGAVHESRSAFVHGLRSILVAPVRLRGRLQGVVYLDSRVAKGIFTYDDADILMAITSHVAVSLETLRAAQLEVAVQAARQQRDLAELLHKSMTTVSTSLDPDEVLRSLLDVVGRALPGESRWLLRRVGNRFSVVAVGGSAPVGPGGPVDRAADGVLAMLADQPAPVLGEVADGQPVPLPDMDPATRAWIAVPLAARSGPVGLLLVAAATTRAYSDAHLQIAAALVGHGMTAYDNASLFAQVNRLATVDSLSGVATRRRFLDLAGQVFDATPVTKAVSALMIDIDHFKRVNDTYGHLVGDTVIQEVARRLRAATRADDLIGRYGGEEFAVVAAGAEHAADLARRMRAAVAAAPVDTALGPIRVTVSIGIADRCPGDTSLGAVLDRADQALYRAKQ
ncbi:MAG TPA: diguanylate cyclase, partial [Pilimelia sp.]|nr:diguanylate cyclase [Pilimelia sp.]